MLTILSLRVCIAFKHYFLYSKYAIREEHTATVTSVFAKNIMFLSFQVLLDWTAYTLSGYYSKKVEVPHEVVEGIWTYLDDVLHSKNLNKVLNQGKTVTLNAAFSQVDDAQH